MIEAKTYFNQSSTKQPEALDIRRQIYHTLMPFKVREILIVSSLYDVFIIEEEGLISELVTGQYHHHLLSSPPRITRANSGEMALKKLQDCPYDLIITMSKNIGMDPFEFGKKVKILRPNLPIILLATDTDDLKIVEQKESEKSIDRVFFWTGDSSLFLAIIKYIEDSINAQYDTVNGGVQVLIMVEDSIRYYSMFLPIIYTEIVQQTRRSLSEDLNEMQRLLRRRARPKILLAQNYEEGIALCEKYKDYVLGIITDINFKKKGKIDPNAGIKIIEHVRKHSKYVRVLMQSSDINNKRKADAINAYFMYKDSPTLLQDFEHFLLKHLGFGDFVFLKPKKKKKQVKAKDLNIKTIEIARASNMKEFEKAIQKVPLESIKFHADRNDFSNWLIARGEFNLAKILRPKKASDFTNLNEVRKHLLTVFNETRRERQLGIITDFPQQRFEFDSSFTKLTGDSLGGKGRGIAFMRNLLTRYNLEKKYPNVKITVPSTVVLGTLEFDRFLTENTLHEYINRVDLTDDEIAQAFKQGKICGELKEKLAEVLKHFKKPIAVRSSSLLEDSQSRPFAGIYSTYMLPNNHRSNSIRLSQLCQAIKLIYSSVYYKEPRAYIKSTSSKIEEEKMAIVIQEVIGRDYGGKYYPTISGVAQSLNFYPVGYQKFEEGIANVAVGLGKTVVGGEKSLRFSPKYPETIPELSSTKQIFDNTQKELYVIDTTKKNFKLTKKLDATLKKISIDEIKNDGTLKQTASTYDKNDGMIRDSFSKDGPNLITFAGILKYNALPLPSIIQDILDIGSKGMGCPVQIEFAIDLNENSILPPTFSILQIRPLVPAYEYSRISWDENVDRKKILIYSQKALGNGVIRSIHNIIYVSPDTFDNTKTLKIAQEIGKLNEKFASFEPYILIGPGRWGSEDRFLGIPVHWSEISNVKVMVETSLENYNIDPSQGTHFFHNITSRGIGYINVSYGSKNEFIDWDWLNNKKPKNKLKYIKHISLSKPLSIKLNGRRGAALILKP
jgi:hypothetical protein